MYRKQLPETASHLEGLALLCDAIRIARGIRIQKNFCLPSPRHKLAGVMFMIEQLILFFLQDALFLLGYLTRGSAFPKPLDREQEAEMLRRMAQGDREARETLIEHNLRLAAHIARKYTVPGCDQDDLVSIGTVGLIKGVNTFKPESGTQLSTYCARCIENPMLSSG